MTALALVFYLIAAAIVAATVLPIWQTSLWRVRLCDFPRYQIAILALTVLILMPVALPPLTAAELVLFVAVFARRSTGGAKQPRRAQCAWSLRSSDDERVPGLLRPPCCKSSVTRTPMSYWPWRPTSGGALGCPKLFEPAIRTG